MLHRRLLRAELQVRTGAGFGKLRGPHPVDSLVLQPWAAPLTVLATVIPEEISLNFTDHWLRWAPWVITSIHFVLQSRELRLQRAKKSVLFWVKPAFLTLPRSVFSVEDYFQWVFKTVAFSASTALMVSEKSCKSASTKKAAGPVLSLPWTVPTLEDGIKNAANFEWFFSGENQSEWESWESWWRSGNNRKSKESKIIVIVPFSKRYLKYLTKKYLKNNLCA